ncbi:MAG: GrpB family protein [Betaproteobacteria bacterium]
MNLYPASEYQATAIRLFNECAKEVFRALPFARVEHVGSSSIPGAISKGDLDICVVVPGGLHENAVTVLEAIGYRIKPDTLRTPELCMLESPREDADIALQLIAAGSKFEFFMRFRDALCAQPLLVEQYNKVKLLAKDRSDTAYREEKSKKANLLRPCSTGSPDGRYPQVLGHSVSSRRFRDEDWRRDRIIFTLTLNSTRLDKRRRSCARKAARYKSTTCIESRDASFLGCQTRYRQ